MRALHEDRQGTLWVGTRSVFDSPSPPGPGGLSRFDPQTDSSTNYQHDPDDPQSLIDNHVEAIFEDSRGTLWVGTIGDGLHTMDRASGTFKRHEVDFADSEVLSMPWPVNSAWGLTGVSALLEDQDGGLWIGAIGSYSVVRYDLECYVKTEDAKYWHHVRGMLAELTVTSEDSPAKEPRGTVDVTLRNPGNGGIEFDSEVRPGRHTVAVHFDEQMVYPTGAQNDIHLVRLEDDTDVGALGAWMNAFDPDGLVSPPAPAEFLGGIEEMPAGSVGYFTVRLTPGTYAWIAEVPDPAAKGMLQTFTVGNGRQ